MTTAHSDRSDLPAWWRQLLVDLPAEFGDLRVGVYGSGGAPFHHAALLALWGLEPLVVRAQDVHAGALERLDVLVFPGGGATAMTGMLAPLGVDGAAAVRRWVADGGMYLGSCAGSFLPAAVGEGYWAAHAEARELHMVSATLANGGDSEWESLTSPGVGTLRVERSDPDHWLVAGLPDRFEIVHYNGPLFDLAALTPTAARGDEALASPEGALRPTGATAAFTASEAFLPGDGDEPPAETLFDRCVARGAHNGIAARYGAGRVVLFGSHPEFGFDALQLGWGPAARLIANALVRQAADVAARTAPRPAPEAAAGSGGEVDDPALRRAVAATAATLERAADRFEALQRADTGGWLAPGHAGSFLGMAPAELWRAATGEAAVAARLAAAALRRLGASGRPLAAAAQWLDDPPRPDQDFGFVGLTQLAGRIEGALATAERRLGDAPVELAHAYDRFDDHPYQLAAGSYLSAAGLAASALLATAVAGARCGAPDAALTARLLADPRPHPA